MFFLSFLCHTFQCWHGKNWNSKRVDLDFIHLPKRERNSEPNFRAGIGPETYTTPYSVKYILNVKVSSNLGIRFPPD
jgi:hypothetical protein